MSYPLETKPLIESGTHSTITGYYSKGHHDADAFMQTLQGVTIPEWVDFQICKGDVAYEWARVVPIGEDNGPVLLPAEPNSRGAFPITHLDFGRVEIDRAEERILAATLGG